MGVEKNETSDVAKKERKVPLKVDMSIAIGSAMIASAAVTPLVLTIDKAVIQAAAGQMRLGAALKDGLFNLIKRPQAVFFSFPFLLVWGVYTSTYIAANSFDVYNERKKP